MEWSNEKVIAFLKILQTEPCLWNPKHKSFKNRASQSDAWLRIMDLIPFKVTIEEMKKKKESLMGYYRTHLHKIKKSLMSGAGKNDVYTTNWFAYETMDSFLRVVYDSNRTLSTEINDSIEDQLIIVKNEMDENDSSHLSTHTEEEFSENVQEENMTLPRETKSSQDRVRKRQLRDDLPPEIRAARRQMDEAFETTNEKIDDECEMFGRLITSKLKKIRNPNTRDMLMNDIQNLVFRTCMADRLEQQPVVSQCSTSMSTHHQVFSPSPNPSSYQSPLGPSTSLSPHHQAFSPSPNPSTCQSATGPSTSLSPHHQAFSPSSNPSTCQSTAGPSTSLCPHHKLFSQSPNMFMFGLLDKHHWTPFCNLCAGKENKI